MQNYIDRLEPPGCGQSTAQIKSMTRRSSLVSLDSLRGEINHLRFSEAPRRSAVCRGRKVTAGFSVRRKWSRGSMMLCRVLTLTFNHVDAKGVRPVGFLNWFNRNKAKAENQLKKNQQETQGSPTDTQRTTSLHFLFGWMPFFLEGRSKCQCCSRRHDRTLVCVCV